MYKNQTNSQIVFHAQCGADAVTKSGAMSTDSFRPEFPRHAAPYIGQLPPVWARVLNEAFKAGTVMQVIYSYSTPIAWKIVGRGWIIPAVTYSQTTSSKHQSQLYRLRGERIYLPWDATVEDVQRVLDGLMVFVTNTRGRAIGTKPGPRYATDEMLALYARNGK